MAGILPWSSLKGSLAADCWWQGQVLQLRGLYSSTNAQGDSQQMAVYRIRWELGR